MLYFKEMEQEKRPPGAWAKNCLEILQEFDPSYKKNNDFL
jgi:hypothetical protein